MNKKIRVILALAMRMMTYIFSYIDKLDKWPVAPLFPTREPLIIARVKRTVLVLRPTCSMIAPVPSPSEVETDCLFSFLLSFSVVDFLLFHHFHHLHLSFSHSIPSFFSFLFFLQHPPSIFPPLSHNNP